MIQIRWIMVLLAAIVMIVAVSRKEAKSAILPFVMGMVYGVLIDLVGANLLRFWEYPGSKLVYCLVTVPCWGIFGVLINLPWNWIKSFWLAFTVITIALFSMMELPNLITRSWVYHVPMWIVVIGWIPLIFSFRAIYCAIIALWEFVYGLPEFSYFGTEKR